MTETTFIRMTPAVELPKYETRGSSGMDIKAFLPFDRVKVIKPGESVRIPTGLRVNLRDNYELQVRPRSGLAFKHGITVLNAPGTIDSDYDGEIGILLINHGKSTYSVEHGDKIAQLVYAKVEILYGAEIIDRERGDGGFGSTG